MFTPRAGYFGTAKQLLVSRNVSWFANIRQVLGHRSSSRPPPNPYIDQFAIRQFKVASEEWAFFVKYGSLSILPLAFIHTTSVVRYLFVVLMTIGVN